MTTQYANIDAFSYTGTLSAKLRDPDTIATLVATGSVAASGTIASRMVCTFTAVSVIPAGVYLLEFIVNGVSYILYVTLTGVDGETALARSERGAVLDSDAQAMVTAFNAMRSGNVFTAPALANAPTGGSGSGSGARTVTITVNDGTTVLENCIVRLTEGANTFTALTNSIGVAVFNLDDATYTVGITKPGYTYSGTSLVVNGDEAETYSMTAISISNPTAGKVARRSIPVTVVDRVT